MLKQSL